jgi:hypothetical protein
MDQHWPSFIWIKPIPSAIPRRGHRLIRADRLRIPGDGFQIRKFESAGRKRLGSAEGGTVWVSATGSLEECVLGGPLDSSPLTTQQWLIMILDDNHCVTISFYFLYSSTAPNLSGIVILPWHPSRPQPAYPYSRIRRGPQS